MKPILFSIFLLLLIVLFYLFQYSLGQYKNYTMTDGNILCSKDLNFCLLSYKEKKKNVEKELPYNTLKKDGMFSVKVAISKTDPSEFIILGSKTIFYGTKFKMLLYLVLLILCLVSFVLFVLFPQK